MKKAEKIYLMLVANLGCCICKRPAEIHHLLTKKAMGKKASHYDVIPLCADHHRNGGHGVAIHSGIKTWEATFGTEGHYLKLTKDALGV